MDHKVSKDMISSGMIPSGEKTQADLGRTQYGSAPSPSSLADAYKSIYEHHQKDKDGNTIPHEGEELNEVAPLALAVPALAKGAAALLSKKAIAGAALKLGSKAAAKTILKKGVAGAAKQGAIAAGKGMAKKPIETAVLASTMKPGPKMPKAPMDPRQKMTGARTAGVYASADLFDIVKGQLLDEGIDEKDALKIMLELSQQDLDIIVNEGLAGNVARLTAAGTVAAMGVNTIRQMNKKKEKMDAGGKFTPGSTMDNIQKKNQAIRDAGM